MSLIVAGTGRAPAASIEGSLVRASFMAMLVASLPVKKVLMPRAASAPLLSSPKEKVTLLLLLAIVNLPSAPMVKAQMLRWTLSFT